VDELTQEEINATFSRGSTNSSPTGPLRREHWPEGKTDDIREIKKKRRQFKKLARRQTVENYTFWVGQFRDK